MADSSPVIRQDLRLYACDHEPDGQPGWLIHDPLANRYYRLGERLIELLPFLGTGTPDQMAQRATRTLSRPVDRDEIASLCDFLRQHNLVQGDDVQQQRYEHSRRQMHQGLVSWLLHRYLFIRLPLVSPDRFLTRALPWVHWLASPGMFLLYAFVAVAAMLLVVRQPDSFLGTFMHLFTVKGVAAYFVALMLMKVLHELGHAFTAKAMGCRVPVMGVAILVGWPVLYTDTTDVWKVRQRGKRLCVGAAGMIVELVIASFCLLGWSLVDDGLLRSILFLLATSAVVMTLLINLNPLMRFDGYFLLSDWLRIPNLEQRAFAMGRWQLREWLFGLGDPAPESGRRGLAFFAFAVWCYRFFLFLGIALLVYQFLFKVAGIILFVAEIFYFIGLPVARELSHWWRRLASGRWTLRSWITISVLSLALVLLVLPWHNRISAPAVLSGAYQTLYSPHAGRLIQALPAYQSVVMEGQEVAALVSPELVYQEDQVRTRQALLHRQYSAIGFDEDLRSESFVIKSQLEGQNRRLTELERQHQLLTIRSPMDGKVVDVTPHLRRGDWVEAGQPLMGIVNSTQLDIVAYMEARELSRLSAGASALFYTEHDEIEPLRAVLEEIDILGDPELDTPYLASVYGGAVAVKRTPAGGLRLQQGMYRARFSVPELPDMLPLSVTRGEVVIRGTAVSIAGRFYRHAMAVLQREAGF